ncbi:MAG: RNA polymerase-binding protein DksA [Candidatus Tectomicrobia bacterium]|nr:RNA polymerase-binding protein DksA [Candidatus Tectomicrobia bacterium]
MEKEQLEFFRQELLRKRRELVEEATRTLSDGLKINKDELADSIDRSAIEADRNFLLRLRERERNLIKKINEALDRIADNTFGICEECGEEISEERLRVRPVATLCIDCKEEEERLEGPGEKEYTY